MLSEKRFCPPVPPLDGTHFCKKRPVSDNESNSQSGHACFMLTEIYIEALLVNEELADRVWDAGDDLPPNRQSLLSRISASISMSANLLVAVIVGLIFDLSFCHADCFLSRVRR